MTQMSLSNNYIYTGIDSCNSGPVYCQEGYGLYFPCLKDITRGQDICFEFYVTNLSNKDVADLNEIDDIVLNLIGQYGCTYGQISDILSLQREETELMFSDDFMNRGTCNLDLYVIDDCGRRISSASHEGNRFYSGTYVVVEAEDMIDHIFVGWVKLTDIMPDCDDDGIYDYIVSDDYSYGFTIDEDVKLYAVYRERKRYKLMTAPDNRGSYYKVSYLGSTYIFDNKPDETIQDGHDFLTVKEGYHFAVECIPITDHVFDHWKDGVMDNVRTFHIGTDTVDFESGTGICLYAICTSSFEDGEDSDGSESNDFVIIPPEDIFSVQGAYLISKPLSDEITEYSFFGDGFLTVPDGSNPTLECDGDNVSIHMHDCDELELSINDSSIDGIRIDLDIDDFRDCEIEISAGETVLNKTVGRNEESPIGTNTHSFIFRESDISGILMKVHGECWISKIDAYQLEIMDKGKAMFCLDSKTTSNIPSGPLSVNGGLMTSSGKSYGISDTQIGVVNRLPKINIIGNE